MFLCQHTTDEKTEVADPEPEEVTMRILRDTLRHPKNRDGSSKHHDKNREPTNDDRLRVPVASFCNDIVTPFSVDANLPLIVLCEPFGDPSEEEPDMRSPRLVTIHLPEQFKMVWEKNRVSTIDFTETERAATFVDSVTFFPSGLFAYSVSFIFDAAEANPLDQDLLLVLSAVAQPAGSISGEPVKFSLNDDVAPLELMAFLRARLNVLFSEAACNRNIFSWLNEEEEACKALASTRNEALASTPNKENSQEVSAIRQSVLQMFRQEGAFERRVFVDIEALGCSFHDRILEYAALSEKREAQVDLFSKALAGLTQNVLDYKQQDAEEIDDSLAGGLRIGTDITFVSRDVAVKFCKESRVTREMRHVVGGSPYWMLVQLVMGHNEALVSNLSSEIDRAYGQAGMIHILLEPKDSHDIEASRERSKQALKRRIRLAYYIPNLFRYPTERSLYRLYSTARGLELRQRYLVDSEAAWDNAVREESAVTKEATDHTFNMTLMALGVIQIGGVLAAIAAIDDTRFWYFGTHVLNGGAEFHAVTDLVAGLFHTYRGSRPADFSAVWALAVAIILILAGAAYLFYLLLQRTRAGLKRILSRMTQGYRKRGPKWTPKALRFGLNWQRRDSHRT
jgi:hypothetical protein